MHASACYFAQIKTYCFFGSWKLWLDGTSTGIPGGKSQATVAIQSENVPCNAASVNCERLPARAASSKQHDDYLMHSDDSAWGSLWDYNQMSNRLSCREKGPCARFISRQCSFDDAPLHDGQLPRAAIQTKSGNGCALCEQLKML